MSGSLLLALILLLPFITAVGVVATGRDPNRRETVTVVSGVLLFLLVAALTASVSWDAAPRLVLAEPIHGLALALSPEPLGMLFALVASFLWPVTSVYAIGYMRAHHEQNQTRFYASFAVSIGAAMGIALAGQHVHPVRLLRAADPRHLSAGHPRRDPARRADAGRVYLGLLLGTSILFLLLAMIWTWRLTGTLEFTPGGIFGESRRRGARHRCWCCTCSAPARRR